MTYKITIETTHEGNELISDVLTELGANGICVNDPMDLNEIDLQGAVWDYLDENDRLGVVTVEGFFDEISKELFSVLEQKLKDIKSFMPCDMGTLNYTKELVKETNWLEEWKKYYKPIILDKISVYPAWVTPTTFPYVQIEPGSAFGTGEHASTKMCLNLLTSYDLNGKNVADIGCGSGILGMAALRLGAKNVYFSDVDEQAIENLNVNLSLNGFDKKQYQTKVASLLDGFNGKVDVLCANITADILIRLRKSIKPVLADDGLVIISGIIREREEEVLKEYQENGFELLQSLKENEWRAFAFKSK